LVLALLLREENMLRGYESRMLRGILGPKEELVTVGLRKSIKVTSQFLLFT
jgi:hypothetical protein